MGEASRPPGYASRTNFAVLPVSAPCGSPPPGSLASAHRSAGETFLCIALRCRGSISWRGADLGRGDGVSREGRVEEREPARVIEADFDQVLRLVAQHAREAALHAACVVCIVDVQAGAEGFEDIARHGASQQFGDMAGARTAQRVACSPCRGAPEVCASQGRGRPSRVARVPNTGVPCRGGTARSYERALSVAGGQQALDVCW